MEYDYHWTNPVNSQREDDVRERWVLTIAVHLRITRHVGIDDHGLISSALWKCLWVLVLLQCKHSLLHLS